jgi:hypothetical protein
MALHSPAARVLRLEAEGFLLTKSPLVFGYCGPTDRPRRLALNEQVRTVMGSVVRSISWGSRIRHIQKWESSSVQIGVALPCFEVFST